MNCLCFEENLQELEVLRELQFSDETGSKEKALKFWGFKLVLHTWK